MFADLFVAGQGRPLVPTDRIAVAMILQQLEGLSDREAATALETDIRWKAAAGMALDEKAFDPTLFVYWRKRLNASDRPHRIDEAVKEVVRQTGVLNGRNRRAMDTTIFDDAVATQDTVLSWSRRSARSESSFPPRVRLRCRRMIMTRRASRCVRGTTKLPVTRWSPPW